MAPGLVGAAQVAPALATTKDSVGPKEAFVGGPQVFDKIAEEQGTQRQPPATHPNYLPVWDADAKYVPASFPLWIRLGQTCSLRVTDTHLLSHSHTMSTAGTLILIFRICSLKPRPLTS